MSTLTYKLNVRFLAKVFVVVLLLAGGVFFLHRYQENRLTSRYLVQANNARDDGKPMMELGYLKQYIAMNPADLEQRIRYGTTMARHGRRPVQFQEAYFSLQHVIAKDPGTPDAVRLQCVKLALLPEVNALDEARRNLEVLFKNQPENSEYEMLFADTLMRSGDLAAAEEFLTKAKNRSRDREDAFMRLARVKRARTKAGAENAAADAVVAEMLDHPAHQAKAAVWIWASDYYLAFGKPKQAEEALGKAVAIAPEDADVILVQTRRTEQAWRAKLPPNVKAQATPELDAALARLGRRTDALLTTLPPLEPRPEVDSPGDRLIREAMAMFEMLVLGHRHAHQLEPAEKWARRQLLVFKPYQDTLPYFYMQYLLLEVLVEADKLEEARQIAGRLNSMNYALPLVELQYGLMALSEKKLVEASRHLERTKAELAGAPEYYRKACSLLAYIYHETGQLDLEAAVLAEATPKDPEDASYVSAKFASGQAALALGHTDEAKQHFQAIQEKAPQVLPILIGLLAAEVAQQPAPVRKWTEVDALQAKLNKFPGPLTEITKAGVQQLKGDVGAARKTLADAAAAFPKEGEIAVRRFQLEHGEKDVAAAESILAKAEADFSDTPGVRHMKVTHLLVKAAGKPVPAADLERLAAGLDEFPKPEQERMLRVLASAARASQRYDLAWKWLNDLEKLRGEQDMDLQFARFDLALLERNDERLNKVLQDIRRIAGKDSPSAKLATAFASIDKAGRMKDEPLERDRLLITATELLGGLDATRKDWSKYHLARGRAADMMQRTGEAIDHYRKAVQQGERQPELVGRLVELLFQEKRAEEIVKLFAQIPEALTMIKGDVEKVMLMYLLVKNYAPAEELARSTVPDASADPVKLLWRVKVHAAAGNLKEAEPLLRRAVDLDPSRSDTYLAYVQLLVDKKQVDEAKRFIAANRGKLKAEDAALTLAQGFVAVKDADEARKLFKDLVEKQGDSVPVLRAAAGFHFAVRDYATARPLFEKLLKKRDLNPADEDMARRMLALCVVDRGDHRTAMQALNVMGFETPAAAAVFNGREPIEELEARFAVLTAIKGRESRLATVAILKQIEKLVPDIGTDKQLAFAKILFALGDWAEAKRRFLIAATATDKSPATIASYAGALLRRGELDEAKKYIDTVAALEPDTILTADLQARHAAYSFQKPKAAEIMKRYLGTKNAVPLVAAQVLESLGMPEDAEPVYRQAAATGANPALRLHYAAFLARQGKAEAALTEFEAVWPLVKLEESVPMLTEAMLHVSGGSHPLVVERALARTRDAVQKGPHLEVFLAAMLSLDSKTDAQALQMFTQIVERDRNNYFALNNLAFMMSLKEGKHNDAMLYLKRAVDQIGPQPTFLDTEAVILITSGKGTEAVEKLQDAIVDEPTAVGYVHLAQAYMLINRKAEALSALREARKFTLRISDFHPLERSAVKSLLSNPALANN